MIKIYHNPRCAKSRQGLALLQDAKVDFEVIKYLESPLEKEKLQDIIAVLDIKPIMLVRKTEKIWKEQYKGKDLSDDALLNAMIENPKLIERPIVTNGNTGVIGRPTEQISELLKL